MAAGCASFDLEWTRVAAPLPNRVYVYPTYIDAYCTSDLGRPLVPPGYEWRWLGCAIRDYAAGVCTIATVRNPPQWLLDHENKHCDGYTHP